MRNMIENRLFQQVSGSLSDSVAGDGSGSGLHAPPPPGMGINDFTCLIGIPLSSQLAPDEGNLGLLRGGHLLMQQAFREQRNVGGPLGPGEPTQRAQQRR